MIQSTAPLETLEIGFSRLIIAQSPLERTFILAEKLLLELYTS
jgi:hypothetical protein